MYELGTVLAGKYRVDHVLGSGGMGVVVAATHLGLGTPVALKFLHAELTQQPNVVERFLREARAAAQLRSENVCRVSDVARLENGTPYLVMELLYGRDLSTMLRANGLLPPVVVAEYMLQACAGLAEAHAARIVHRDLKPANLFLTQRPDGTPLIKLLDFGVAKDPQSGDFSLTQTSNVIGSPGYMSPEQLKSSREVDARSDIWSLGIVMFELLAGKQPFLAESITELALRVAMDRTPSLPHTPKPLADIIAKCLEKEPARRYRDVGALAAALATVIGPGAQDYAAGIARVLRGASPVRIARVVSTPSAPTTLRGASGVIAGGAAPSPYAWTLPAVIGASVAAAIVSAVMVVGRGGSGGDGGTHVQAPAPTVKLEAKPSDPPPAAPAPPPAAPPSPPPAPVPEPKKVEPHATPVTPTPAPTPVPPKKKPVKPKVEKVDDVGESRF